MRPLAVLLIGLALPAQGTQWGNEAGVYSLPPLPAAAAAALRLDTDARDDQQPLGRLAQEWAIWHEVGPIRQPYSRTRDSLTEVNVNVWSRFVQQARGRESRLAATDRGTSSRAQARDTIGQAGGPADDRLDDDETVFIRLVMVEQLARDYGWDQFRALNRVTRASPLPAGATDQDKVGHVVRTICRLTGHDLRPFFARWSLLASDRVLEEIGQSGLPAPPTDPARLL